MWSPPSPGRIPHNDPYLHAALGHLADASDGVAYLQAWDLPHVTGRWTTWQRKVVETVLRGLAGCDDDEIVCQVREGAAR